MTISKEEILFEIKKLAAATGGVAPGQGTFSAVTGIKTSTWKGKYWARWGDALVEAGFTPNTLNPKIPKEHVLGELASFVTELGRFPVQPEFNMRSRNTANFPSYDTYIACFGNMMGTVTALLEHSQATGNSKLAELCEARIAQEQSKPAPKQVAAKRPGSERLGFVYLKYSPSLRLYKIGKANDSDRRGKSIGILLPEDLVPKHEIKTDQSYILEKYWHGRFRQKKKQGEWFDLNTVDIEAFKKRREFMFSEFFP